MMVTNIQKDFSNNKSLYIMIIPCVIFCSVFIYYPILQGFIMSIQDYKLLGESQIIGFKHYKEILTDINFWRYFRNTIVIGGGYIVFGFISQVTVAILLNELPYKRFKKLTQTIIYTPHLFSWVAIGGIWISLLAPKTGLVNMFLVKLGYEAIPFMTDINKITPVFWFLSVWKSVGYGCIIFLAALMGIDPNLFEAAKIDGANRFKQIMHITLPGLYSTMKVVIMLNIISSLRMFTQSYVLTNPSVMDKTEVIMTYTFKLGLDKLRLDYASAIACIMLLISLIFYGAYQFVTRGEAK